MFGTGAENRLAREALGLPNNGLLGGVYEFTSGAALGTRCMNLHCFQEQVPFLASYPHDIVEGDFALGLPLPLPKFACGAGVGRRPVMACSPGPCLYLQFCVEHQPHF